MATKGPKPRSAFERAFPLVVQEPNGCWSYRGRHDKHGYGRIDNAHGSDLLHRVMYEHFIGPVPVGLELDHEKGDNPGCCNPLHVVPKTHRENMIRSRAPSAVAYRNGTCTKGHDVTGPNGYRFPNGRPRCRICHAAASKAYYWSAKKRQAVVSELQKAHDDEQERATQKGMFG